MSRREGGHRPSERSRQRELPIDRLLARAEVAREQLFCFDGKTFEQHAIGVAAHAVPVLDGVMLVDPEAEAFNHVAHRLAILHSRHISAVSGRSFSSSRASRHDG